MPEDYRETFILQASRRRGSPLAGWGFFLYMLPSSGGARESAYDLMTFDPFLELPRPRPHSVADTGRTHCIDLPMQSGPVPLSLPPAHDG
jgi:hypothetical protein